MQESWGAQADVETGTDAGVVRIALEGAASGEPLGSFEISGPDAVHAAVARARAAQVAWAKLALEERCERILVLRDTLVDRADTLVEAISKECGKPAQEALVHELMPAVDLAGFYAKRAPKILAPREIDLHLFKHRKSYVHYAPLGVVAVISPANYPLIIPIDAALTALIAGNAVVLKPSERGTFVALKLKEVFDAAGLPPDLLQVVGGGASTVLSLLDAQPDKVVFTGTERVGRKVAALCGERLIPCTLELGGKGPLIVCEDADIERAARAIVFAAFANGGQVCVGVQRVFAHTAIHDALLDRVTRLTRELRQGDPALGAVEVGALASPSHLAAAEAAVKDALDRGAQLVNGGARAPGKGCFFAPTVLANCPPEALIMREEVLAPVVGFARVSSDDEAVERANDARSGLVGHVFTRDKLRGRSLADRVRAGTVMVNDVLTAFACPEAPFGGVKKSGYGRVHGDEGLREMCEVRHVNYNRVPTFRTEPVWFPYRNATQRTMKRLMRAFMRSGSPMKKVIDLL
jgi:succinate-semialdehyde dehydrogenase/glutarate-semialdehyde dehydrogenase